MSLSSRDSKIIWHPYTQMLDSCPAIAIVRGEGAYLFGEKGERYIDAISSWWTNIHGHAHPYIANKVAVQLQQLEHVLFAGFTHEPAVVLAEKLLEKLPSNQARIFYSDNGSTAVEVALKMAFQYWHNKGAVRNKVIAFKNAYHGDTFGAMSVSGRGAFNEAFKNLLFDVIYIDAPVKGSEETSFLQLENALSDNIASFIFEPMVQGSAGMVMHSGEQLQRMIALCKSKGVITIADEVMTGFGRTGKFFALDHLSENTDIVCLSKGITGGAMAMGVTSCSQNIYDAFLSDDKMKTFFHGHSYTANPVSCSSAIASMELFEIENTFARIASIEAKHKGFMKKNKDSLHSFNCCGTILAIEMKTKEGTSYFNSLRDKAYAYFMSKGILLRPLGNVIYLMPPYCISDKDLDYIYNEITSFLNSLDDIQQ